MHLAKSKKRAKISETEAANSSVEEVHEQGGQEVAGTASSPFKNLDNYMGRPPFFVEWFSSFHSGCVFASVSVFVI